MPSICAMTALKTMRNFPDDLKILKRIVANNYILQTITYGDELFAVADLGLRYLQSGQYEEAVIQFKRIVTDSKQLSEDKYKYLLAICYLRLEKYDEAAELLVALYRKKAYQVEPVSKWIGGAGSLCFRECIYEEISRIAHHDKKVGRGAMEGGDTYQLLVKSRGTPQCLY